MPIHDWTRVKAGIFHDFHLTWLSELKRALNAELPEDYYALAEQWASEVGPDVLTLRRPVPGQPGGTTSTRPITGGVALQDSPPKVRIRLSAGEDDYYARKRRRLVIRHVTGDEIIAVVEFVSPGNKSSVSAIRDFVQKAWDLLSSHVNLLVIDLFPPTARDPDVIHNLIWESDDPLPRPTDQNRTCAAYAAGPVREAFVEPVSVGDTLPEMPLFLTPDRYINVPLETTYLSAFQSLPKFIRQELSK